jgi:hypothetical protein
MRTGTAWPLGANSQVRVGFEFLVTHTIPIRVMLTGDSERGRATSEPIYANKGLPQRLMASKFWHGVFTALSPYQQDR